MLGMSMSQSCSADARIELQRDPARLEITIEDLLSQEYRQRRGWYGHWFEVQLEGLSLDGKGSQITEAEIEELRQKKDARHYVIPDGRLCVADYNANEHWIVLAVGWPRTRGESDDNDTMTAYDVSLIPRRLVTLDELSRG